MSDAANYATAEADRLSLYDMTIKPECSAIAEVLNEQVFAPLGFRFQFQPEGLDLYKANEEKRSASLASLRMAGLPLLMAMDILGYELTDQQRAELEQAEVGRRAQADALAAQLDNRGESDREEEPGDRAGEELRTWRRWALRRVRQGRALRDFETRAAIAGAGWSDCRSA